MPCAAVTIGNHRAILVIDLFLFGDLESSLSFLDRTLKPPFTYIRSPYKGSHTTSVSLYTQLGNVSLAPICHKLDLPDAIAVSIGWDVPMSRSFPVEGARAEQ